MRKLRSGTHMKVLKSGALVGSMHFWDKRDKIELKKCIDKYGVLIYNYKGAPMRTYSYNKGYTGAVVLPEVDTGFFSDTRETVYGLKLAPWPKKEKKNAKIQNSRW